MSDSVKKGLLLAGVIVLGATQAHAALALPTLATDALEKWFGFILVGLAAIWGYRKMTAMTNKS